jgi:hypothetical protein
MRKDDIPASVINAGFAEKLERGMDKEASVTLTSYIRDEVREGSYAAKIMTEQPITNDQLDKDEDLDVLKKIVEIEPDSTATWVSFRGLPPSRYLKQSAGTIYFAQIVTEKVVKNIFELKTRDNDVRKIISDNHVKDILEQQDGKFMETCRAIIAAAPGQSVDLAGGLTKNNFVEALKVLPAQKLPNGVILMNEATAKDFLKWNAADIGYEIVSRHYESGLTEGEAMGVKIITTMRSDQVLDNEMWIYPPEEYLGKFFTLQDSTAFVKTEGLFVEFYAYKCLGMGILKTEGVIRRRLTP